MIRTLLIIAVTASFALLNVACASGPRQGASQQAAAASADAGKIDAAAYERYSVAGGRTFLDTLNHGKEIALSPEDLPALEVAPPVVAAAAAAQQQSSPAEEPRFRIQILASSQADMARREKVNAAAAFDLPVSMISEQSLFKVFVGSFKTRAEAEAALPKVRGKGYDDAWIVNVK